MKVVVSPEAEERLMSSLELYATYMSDASVKRRRQRVMDGLRFLALHPRSGSYAEEIRPGEDGLRYRKWVVDHFKIIYKIVGEEIRVSDNFDGRQDPRKMKG